MQDTPVLILAFNRPEDTQQVFDQVAKVKPKQLFVAVDGPRSHKPGEADKCEAVKRIFVEQVNWDCELKTLFRAQNLGCRDALNGAISWFFSLVDEGIILEDDCVPDLSFFKYCEELLDFYRDDQSVMHISGYRPQDIPANHPYSYSFTRQAIVSGWATWASAWQNMDVDMLDLPKYLESGAISDFLSDKDAQEYITEKWLETYEKRNSSWAYAWSFSIIKNKGLTIIPKVNLVQHIGYGADATNTLEDTQGRFANHAQKILLPLQHYPIKDGVLPKIDEQFEKEIFYKIQKSKLGLIRRRLIPKGVLSLGKKILNRLK